MREVLRLTAEQAMQATEANLYARAAQIGELTSDAFAQEYPKLYQYCKDMAGMSYQMLSERDELRDFWNSPVVDKEGQIVQRRRILWYGRPLRPEIPTLAILTSRMDGCRFKASKFCMFFNRPGGCQKESACWYLHNCLCCGSLEHGFKDCNMSHKLYQEAQKFQRIFGLDPLDPSSKWAGNSLEKVLLKLVGSELDEELEDASAGAPEVSEYPEDLPATVDSAPAPPGLTRMNTVERTVAQEHFNRSVDSNASDSEEAVDADDDAVSFTSTAPSQSGATKSPLSWTYDEVAKWLQNLDAQYSRYVPEFLKQEISGQSLKDLTLEELKEDLQVKQLGPRKIIYAAIQKLFK